MLIETYTSRKRSNLCDYIDTCIHVKATITIPNTAAAAALVNNNNKTVMFKNCAPFTNCVSKINNTQIYDAHDIDIVMLMYKLTEHSDLCSKTSGSLTQYYRDERALDHTNNNIDFPANNNNSVLFTFKQQITGQTRKGDIKDIEIMVPLKYLTNFWITLEMPLINCQINLQLKWSGKCILVAGTAAKQVPEFRITDTKLVPVVILSTKIM